jgi:hypothetical protein
MRIGIPNSNGTLSPGSYRNITVNGGRTLTLTPGTYNLNSLKLSGGAKIVVATLGQVIVNIAGANVSKPIDLSGGSVTNQSAKPANFVLVYGGDDDINVTGQADSYGLLYAPNAAAKLSGQADWFGALVVKTLDGSGGGAIHYDRNLSH